MRRSQKHCTTFGCLRRKATIVPKCFGVPEKLGFLKSHSEMGSRTAIVTVLQPKTACASASYKTLTVWEIIFELTEAFHNMKTLNNNYNLLIQLQLETWFFMFYFHGVSDPRALAVYIAAFCSQLSSSFSRFFCSQWSCEVQPNDKPTLLLLLPGRHHHSIPPQGKPPKVLAALPPPHPPAAEDRLRHLHHQPGMTRLPFMLLPVCRLPKSLSSGAEAYS